VDSKEPAQLRRALACPAWPHRRYRENLDIIATARYLHQKYEGKCAITISGQESGAVLAAYATLFEPEIAEAILRNPVLSHNNTNAPHY